jgi:hypothetical protein
MSPFCLLPKGIVEQREAESRHLMKIYRMFNKVNSINIDYFYKKTKKHEV